MNGELFVIFWISIKAIHQEALGCYMFHNISKHISISVFRNFCLMFCGFFAEFLKTIAREWGFSRIFLPQGSGFRTWGWGIRSFKKIPRGFARGMVRLGIDRYIIWLSCISFHRSSMLELFNMIISNGYKDARAPTRWSRYAWLATYLSLNMLWSNPGIRM